MYLRLLVGLIFDWRFFFNNWDGLVNYENCLRFPADLIIYVSYIVFTCNELKK